MKDDSTSTKRDKRDSRAFVHIKFNLFVLLIKFFFGFNFLSLCFSLKRYC